MRDAVLELTGGRPLRGRIRPPGDKSISHRALLLGARADGTSVVRGLSGGEDVLRTRTAVRLLGAEVDGERITGGTRRLHECEVPIDLGNSGTGMRLLAGYVAAWPWLTILTGDEYLSRRPMDRVADPLRRMGASVDGRDHGGFPPLAVRGGGLVGIDYELPVASAQVKSAVLLAGLAADGETVVRERVPTRAHTEEMLAACGADIETDGLVTRLRASRLQPFELDVPADPSQASFWVVAATIVPGSDVVVEGVYLGQARTGFLDVLRRMGADVQVDESTGDIRVRAAELRGTEVAGAEVPGLIDEIAVLAVAAAVADGPSTFRDAGELVVKETNRITTITSELGALGGRVEPTADGMVVVGGGRFRGGVARSRGDHRVGMAMAIAGLAADGTTRVEGWDAVATSYPGFQEDLKQLCE